MPDEAKAGMRIICRAYKAPYTVWVPHMARSARTAATEQMQVLLVLEHIS